MGYDGSGSGYRRVGDANLKVNNITNRDGSGGTEVDGIVEVNSTSHFIPPSGTTAERGSRGRGIFNGGYAAINTIEYITIATLGNTRDFGDLLVGRRNQTSCSSSIIGCTAGGYNGSAIVNSIDFVTISSTGNAFDFGDLNQTTQLPTAFSNNTRDIIGG